jgi:hypothetical protein
MTEFFSITISAYQAKLLTKAILLLKNEVVVNPRKNSDLSLTEMNELLDYIEKQKNWRLDQGVNNL